MVDDQSVIGKYQMYHDKNKGEMVICSDNEEEIVDPEDVKHEFTEVEDKFLRMTLEEYGCTEEVLNVVKKFVKTTNSEIQIFDCPMHGINKPLVYHSENQPVWLEPEGDKKPCSDQCYLMLKDARILSKNSTQWSFQDKVITTMEEDSILPRDDEENHTVYYASLKSLVEHTSEKLTISGSSGHGECDKRVVDGQKDLINGIKLNQISISREVQANGMSSDSYWRPLEMDLYLKGVKMFGKNSCLIAITLLPGLKTCLEVARTKKCHQDHDRNEKKENLKSSIILESLLASHLDGEKLLMGKTCVISNILLVGAMEYVERNVPVLLMELAVKNIAGVQNTAVIDLEDAVAQKVNAKVDHVHVLQPTVNVTQMFVKIVGCGDDSLGRLPRHEDAKCGNMNLLLGQKERILLAKSDVIGWGAFAKNPISKNVCLGEYTGELIPPKEAEKRGKLYDRINTSFLFNLNDQASWVIDAFRMGDKLKFANHSSKPNCYAKVMLVGGDHRVGIFARENIKAGDEIFYDYGYDLDSAPLWALPPNEAAKKDKLVVSLSRTKKKEKKSVSFQ
ncbi:Histone-lysine N-methyltransferase EZ3 [Glycine soja]|nr:Histone-lysine N-methyltransferase EZ3 [Glycine soja]